MNVSLPIVPTKLSHDQLVKLVTRSIDMHEVVHGTIRDASVRASLHSARLAYVKLINDASGPLSVVDTLFSVYTKGRHTLSDFI